MRALVILVICFQCLSAKAEVGNPFFVGFETKTGWSDSWGSSLRYARITQSAELRYRFASFLAGYTYLVGQTGWAQVHSPAPEFKNIGLYLRPNALAGQGIEAKKTLLGICVLAVFAEMYVSLHTAVVDPYAIDSILPKNSPSLILNAYDTNVGEFGLRVGFRAYKNFRGWSARLGVQYELDDFDIFMNPKVWAFAVTPPKVSQINATWQFMRFAGGINVNLPKRLRLLVDANLDTARPGVSGYGAAIGLGYSF